MNSGKRDASARRNYLISRTLLPNTNTAHYKQRSVFCTICCLRISDAKQQLQLEENSATNARTQALEQEVKEKTLLIGKLRHEGGYHLVISAFYLYIHVLMLAVIINEHLMEALRRLRRGATNMNVDRRLVTNMLLTFLNTPREDTKRFEILGLLASILSWSDEERGRAGLQRTGANSISTYHSPIRSRPLELEKTDETEVRGAAHALDG